MPDRFDFQLLSAGLRRVGWIRFWIQVVLGVVVLGVLLFTAVGGSLARNAARAFGNVFVASKPRAASALRAHSLYIAPPRQWAK